ncbi:FAD-dependent monooxygenase [Subtercola sp. YIM 133946]|uniref:FAD-dependent monooxygenase n=1 Tax=Subtercola sp. YIM 133946 TaxID=3118909 RepID=UPI002F929DCA
MTPLRVLIVGAGPAGMVAALALARTGAVAHVVELESSHTAAGIGVNLQNSPLRALDSLGLLDAIERAGYPTGVVNMLDATGAALMPPLRPESLVPGRPASIAIGRAELGRILSEAVGTSGVVLRFGLTVDGLRSDRSGVDVTFSDGGAGRYDLVIGADGINSRVRDLMMGSSAPKPQHNGQSIWRASAARGDLTEYQLYNGPVSKVGLVPLSDTRMYLYLLESRETASGDGQHRDESDDRFAELHRALAPFGGMVPEIAGRLEPDIDFRSLKWLLLDDPWYRGRILVIGDAAHASTPHISYGLGIAIEDGIVLAELLRVYGDDVDALLAAFMRLRFDRCRLVVQNSRQLGEWEQHPPADPSVYGRLMAETIAELSEPLW